MTDDRLIQHLRDVATLTVAARGDAHLLADIVRGERTDHEREAQQKQKGYEGYNDANVQTD